MVRNDETGKNDLVILSSKGGNDKSKEGNIRYNQMIAEYSERYRDVNSKAERMKITKVIYERARKEIGEFVKSDGTVLLETLARDKISHALRSVLKKRNATSEHERIINDFTEILYHEFGNQLQKFKNMSVAIDANVFIEKEKELLELYNDFLRRIQEKSIIAPEVSKKLATFVLATALPHRHNMFLTYKNHEDSINPINLMEYFRKIVPLKEKYDLKGRRDRLDENKDAASLETLENYLKDTEESMQQIVKLKAHPLFIAGIEKFTQEIRQVIDEKKREISDLSEKKSAASNLRTNSHSNKKDFDQNDPAHLLELSNLISSAFSKDYEKIKGKLIEIVPNKSSISEQDINKILKNCLDSVKENYNYSETLLQNLNNVIAAQLNKLEVTILHKINNECIEDDVLNFVERRLNELRLNETTEVYIDPLPLVGKPIDSIGLHEFLKETPEEKWDRKYHLMHQNIKNGFSLDHIEKNSKNLTNWYKKSLVKYYNSELNQEQRAKIFKLIEVTKVEQLNEKHRKVESSQGGTTKVNFDNFTLNLEDPENPLFGHNDDFSISLDKDMKKNPKR